MAHATHTPIEVDPEVLDNHKDDDGGYESSGYDTSTASLTSSINEYVFENGRRYHTYYGVDKNLQPTDEKEQDRLDIHHEIFLRLLDGKLHLAPIREPPHNVLDIGTGTGLWAIDFADTYPTAQVVGTDLSPIQPNWVPPNLRFEVDDAEQPFTYKPNSFDFVHIRNLAQGISHWPRLMSQVYDAIAPGGHVELAELGFVTYSDDGTLPETHGGKVFLDHLRDAMSRINRPAATSTQMKIYLEDAGFENIQVHDLKQPFGMWPRDRKLKQVGAMALLSADTGYHAYGMAAFTRILGMDPAEAERICDEAVKATKNRKYHVYNYFHVVHGNKPSN